MKRKSAGAAKAKPKQEVEGVTNLSGDLHAEPPQGCLTLTAHGCVLSLSVVPNGQRTEVLGFHDHTLRLRLAAPPVDGRANDMLVAWLAAQWGLPRRALRIKTGEHARRKRIEVEAPPSILQHWLEGLGLPAP